MAGAVGKHKDNRRVERGTRLTGIPRAVGEGAQ
jgi:hypothetical protein